MSNTKLFVSYVEHEEYGELDLFLDENMNIIGVVYNNDANWRHEYFNGILAKLGVDVVSLDEGDVDNLDEKLKLYMGF